MAPRRLLRSSSSSPSSPSSPSDDDRAYWLRSELRGAIYGRVRRGTALRRLENPVGVPGGGGRYAHWISTSVHVAIKEVSWELVGEHGSRLAEDPIKEVAAMQYLRAFVREEEEGRRRRRRRGGGGGPEDGGDGGGDGYDAMASWSPKTAGAHDDETEDDDDYGGGGGHVMMPMDLLSDDTNLYSITPYCNGGRLLDRLERKGRFSEPEARHWMRQILKVRNAGRRRVISSVVSFSFPSWNTPTAFVHSQKMYARILRIFVRFSSDNAEHPPPPMVRARALPGSVVSKEGGGGASRYESRKSHGAR